MIRKLIYSKKKNQKIVPGTFFNIFFRICDACDTHKNDKEKQNYKKPSNNNNNNNNNNGIWNCPFCTLENPNTRDTKINLLLKKKIKKLFQELSLIIFFVYVMHVIPIKNYQKK